jgi:RNA polymerase sigma factor (sigma-70 family)
MMSAEDPGSVTRWIDELKAGQADAAAALWQRYYERLIQVARQRLGPAPRQTVEDAEDAALSAIHGLFAGAAQGRFQRLTDRVDLWQLLVAITVKKALSQRQWHGRLKRGGHHVIRGENAIDNVDDDDQDNALAQACSREPEPESAAMIQDQFQRLLNSLSDPTLQKIALWRMDGLSNGEIAQKMGCVVRTVERKMERIRLIWEEIGDETSD